MEDWAAVHNGWVGGDEDDADGEERTLDGLEIMAAFCSIDDPMLRRGLKRVILAVCKGQDARLLMNGSRT